MLHLASTRATWVFFAIPIFLLLGIGALADRATSSFAQSEYWVSHTHEVRNDPVQQMELTRQNEDLSGQMTAIFQSMVAEENGLLAERVVISIDTYRRMRIVLAVALIAVVLFLLLNFSRLLVELLNRSRAEAAVRRLSGGILQLQDMERRRVPGQFRYRFGTRSGDSGEGGDAITAAG